MSSGVRFTESIRDGTDVARLAARDVLADGAGRCGGGNAVQYERAVPTGTKFSYASAETQVLGLCCGRPSGGRSPDYLSEKIWQRSGHEADADVAGGSLGQEATYCCINAVLRDYARLDCCSRTTAMARPPGHPGRLDRGGHDRATGAGHLKPRVATPFFGYGYQTWIFRANAGCSRSSVCAARRSWSIPANRIVMVHTAVRKQPGGGGATEVGALWRAVVTTLADPARALTAPTAERRRSPLSKSPSAAAPSGSTDVTRWSSSRK